MGTFVLASGEHRRYARHRRHIAHWVCVGDRCTAACATRDSDMVLPITLRDFTNRDGLPVVNTFCQALMIAASDRHRTIDALRGFALFGILAVNIQSFVWGVSAPTLAPLTENASTADAATVWWTAFLLEYKIYPIFCFCFGYGFAVMTAGWQESGMTTAAVKTRLTRRLTFMFVLGLGHGILVWFGDILSRYALAALFLRGRVTQRAEEFTGAIRKWLVITVILVLVSLMMSLLSLFFTSDDLIAEMQAGISADFSAYGAGSYVDTMMTRIRDYAWVMFSWLFVFPQAVMIFLIGALVAKREWLKHAAMHRTFWWKVLIVSLIVGLPISWLQANAALENSLTVGAPAGPLEVLVLNLAPTLAPTYIAAFALIAASPFGAKLLSLLEPAGKLALTNYLMQSVLMTIFLAGYGLAWGDRGQWFILQLACAIFVAQLVLSHVYLRFRQQGPMEALWRAYTYRASPVDSHLESRSDR